MEITTRHLCYNCFQERPEGEGPCPYCGFDLEENVKKFPVALRAGTVLNDRYIVGRVLGQGGFGITYLALDTQLSAKVAIKEFMPNDIATRIGTTVSVAMESKSEAFTYGAERFMEEARTLAKFIGNPNIAGVTSYFDENETSYFVMDYIEGISFKTYIANQGGKVSVEDACNVMIPVLRALTAVHQEGFIHRDVTPDNIYITKDGVVKLLDFGSARYSIGDKSKSLDVILKVGYAPKEQYIRRSRQGPYTDVYSCAACFYAAITGYLPPESLERLDKDELVPISQLGIEIPEYLDKAILKGLAVQPEDRFQSAAEFLDAIESQQVVEVPGQAPAASAPVSKEDLVAKIRKKPVFFGVLAAAVVALVASLALFTGGAGGGGDDGRPLKQSAVPSITIRGETYSTDLRELKLTGMGLTDSEVQDIRYMVNVDNLDLSGNDITDLSFLTELTELRNLRLSEGNNNLTDLSPLAGLTNLKSLQLPAEGQVSDLSPLAGLTNLETLWFNGNWGNTAGYITDLSPLENLANLTNVGIKIGTVTDFTPLTGLTKLQELSLYGDISALDLSALGDMTGLTRLYLSSMDGSNGVAVQDLSALSGLTNLQDLQISVNGLKSFHGLEGATKLTQLQIYGSPDIQDLSALSGLTKLQSLQISGSGTGNLKSLQGLEGMTQLRELRLYVDGLESLEGLQGATGLTSLEINGENYSFTDLSPLAPLTKLQKLRIQSYGNTSGVYVKDLSALSGMAGLQELQLYIDGVDSLKGLENLTNLTTCSISGTAGTLDLSVFLPMTKLTELTISNSNGGSTYVRDLTGLSNMTGLQSLQMPANGLESLKGLENLTKLTTLRLNGADATYTDLSPLAGLVNLQELSLPSRNYDDKSAVDLSGLSGLTKLQILEINGRVKSLEPLRSLTSLKNLRFYGDNNSDYAGVSLEPLGNLTNLTELYINSNVPGNDITALGNLTQLRSLTLYIGSWDNPVRDISALSNLTNLTSFRMNNSADNLDTSPVAHVPDLDIY